MMNPPSAEAGEWQELLQQTREHLQYLQELGVTHLGDAALLASALVATPPTAPRASTPAQALKAESVAALASVATRVESPVPSTQEPAMPEPIPPPTITPPTITPTVVPAVSLSPSTPLSSTSPSSPSLTPMSKPSQPQAHQTQSSMERQPVMLSLFDEPPAVTASVASSETLEEIRLDLGECQRCKLWQTRTNIVFGDGNPHAELMFVGEAPGADEDATGRPFVGRAGQLLNKMIEAIGFKREEIYIANILKSRPPGNRDPEADETRACKPFLLRQITAIKPKLIVTLGNPATQGLLETKVGITKLRGELQNYVHDPTIKVIPTFHPAYLLRSPDKKREAWEDLKKVRAFLRGA